MTYDDCGGKNETLRLGAKEKTNYVLSSLYLPFQLHAQQSRGIAETLF